MIDSYKNIERLRYRINLDLNEIKESIDRNSSTWYEEMKVQISSAVLSALMAGAITNSEFSNIKCCFTNILSKVFECSIIISILGWSFSILFFLILFGAIYVVFDFVAKKIIEEIKINVIHKQAKVDYQKEFDNIACDSIFVAIEYQKEYLNNLDESDNLKVFYFYEIMHYLETACIITRNLCLYKDEYIRLNANKATGIEIYRIHNMVNLINDLLDFANSQKGTISIPQTDRSMITQKINDIQSIMNESIKPCMDSI